MSWPRLSCHNSTPGNVKEHQPGPSLFPAFASQARSPSQNTKQPQASMAILFCFLPKTSGLLTGPGHQGFFSLHPRPAACTLYRRGSWESCSCSCTWEREPCTRLILQQTGGFCKHQTQLDSPVAFTVCICQQFHLSKHSPSFWSYGEDSQSTERDVR